MYRQGDVLLERIEEIPEARPTEERLLIRGEGRNHGHFIVGSEVKVFENSSIDESKGSIVTHYLEIKEPARLDHLLIDSGRYTDKHESIDIPPGTYRVIRQREYNPYTRAIKMIRD